MAHHDSAGFEFVAQQPNKRLSSEARSKIRRHAMRAVGAARRNPADPLPPSRKRQPQVEPHLLPQDDDKDDGGPKLSPPMPLSGLELLVRDRRLDPVDLSALASVHIGPIASKMLQQEPERLPGVLSCRQWSYFSFVPARFGHSAALDDAFRCLATAAHSALVPAGTPGRGGPRSRDVILAYYGRALASLQAAVDEPKTRHSAEVLCAAAMLAIFELLNSPKGELWCSHVAGASHLIQSRGPAGFKSDFDKALLMALGYPVCVEALLNNEKCFLDDPAWATVINDIAVPDETFTDRSPLGTALLVLMSKIPGLAKRNSHAVTVHPALPPGHLDALIADIRAVRSGIIAWRRAFSTALLQAVEGDAACSSSAREVRASSAKRYELAGVGLVVQMVATRMLVCLVPAERGLLEEEVQGLAAELKGMQSGAGPNGRATFFLAQKAQIADAVIATREVFAEAVGSGDVVEVWRLRRFCKAVGRRYCDGVKCCS